MKDISEQINQRSGSIVWLASFPKSGNTWFRCFLSALIDQEVDINQLHTDGIFSSRRLFDITFDIDGRLLTEAEIKNRMPRIIRHYAQKSEKLLFCKIHDAYSINSKGAPIIPHDVSDVAIYLIRNPLDVVASYANHMNCDIDKAISSMNKDNGYLARQKNGMNINNQFPQLMYSWSGHVQSWHNQDKIKVVTIRYEDMKQKSLETFTRATEAMSIEADKDQIQKAIELTQFEKIKNLESEQGFKEKNILSANFFRKGKVGGYQEELTKDQINMIIDKHGDVMSKFGYL